MNDTPKKPSRTTVQEATAVAGLDDVDRHTADRRVGLGRVVEHLPRGQGLQRQLALDVHADRDGVGHDAVDVLVADVDGGHTRAA